jgi:predicted transposase YbfD/YdcC
MTTATKHSIRHHFATLPDPRREHLRLHSLWDMIALTICAVIAGADSWVEVEEYGLRKYPWLSTFLELLNGIPSHDTFSRVFARIDPEAFRDAFAAWVACLVEATAGRLVPIDGKTLRGSGNASAGQKPLHLVTAWAAENHLVLGQVAVDDKSNEITAIPELLKTLDLKGAIVTIDAMGCQKEIAQQIDAKGGDFVLTLKENHKNLYNDVQQIFQRGLEDDFAKHPGHREYRTEETGHGRHEVRTYHVLPAPAELLINHPQWKGLRTLGMECSQRQVGDGEMSCELRFFLLSLAAKVKTFAGAVRGHWGIENNLHWVLDVGFREDESRVYKDHGPENLAAIRRLAVGLLNREGTARGGIACKRKQAGWDDDYLQDVLAGILE